MEKKLSLIKDFVLSLEANQLSDEQQSVLLEGDGGLYAGGDNDDCHGSKNKKCINTGNCNMSINEDCSNTGGTCIGANNGCDPNPTNCQIDTRGCDKENQGNSLIGFPGFDI